jgi:fermentation-respiration switch protein FrsA (DUF1100 family)
VLRLLSYAATLYIAYATLAFLLQRRVLFPGAHLQPYLEVRVDTLPGVELLWFQNGSGYSEAWFQPPPGAGSGQPGPVVIFQHGNAEFIDYWADVMPAFSRLGVGVLLLEYPGYGRSTGRPSQRSIATGAVAAFDWLHNDRRVDPDRIVAMGRSLGGGAALVLTLERPVAALILQSTFTSVSSLASRAYWLPRFLVRDPFDNLAAAESYQGPALLFHGTYDDVIPFRHAQALTAASPRGTLVRLQCGHNDCPPSWEVFWSTVRRFLREEGILDPEPVEPGDDG